MGRPTSSPPWTCKGRTWLLLLICATWCFTVPATSSVVQRDTDDDDDSPAVTYTDQWAVHIEGGPLVADEIARRNDFINLGKIVGDYYHFQHRKLAKRAAVPSTEHDQGLTSETQVRWAQQQVVKRRVKRDLIELDPPSLSDRSRRSPDPTSAAQGTARASRRAGSSSAIKARSVSINLNDPRWTQMWYLNRGMGLDMNVQEAWAEGVTGRGVVVTILDDGLEKDHPDIRRNYDPQASYDVNGHDDDPMPRYDLIDSNRHGTRCAGEVAAEGNNSICAVGVAYDASIGGVRMLDGDVTDAVEARSLSLNPHHIDIYSASWGPDDDGKTVDGPGELATRAFIEGVTKGRGGRGSIFVWASGNGGRDHDNCNCDGYTNSIWTLSISSATENGYVPWYSEACSSTLATTYSSGSSGEKQVVTTDLHHSCTASHTGTSASAPLAAGICALALESNHNLTWRDMQHIVVRSAKPANLKADDWQINGVGRNVSHSFGYGLMDAAAMVRIARSWNTVPPQQFCEIRAPDSNKLIPAKSQVQIHLDVSECSGVNYMEHVQARITLAAVSRGDIQINLSSPSGTRSTLLALRPHDSSRNGFHSWPFMSVHYWGESPFGVWTLEIQNEGRFLATLSEWNVVIYGTKENPDAKNRAAAPASSPSIAGVKQPSTNGVLSNSPLPAVVSEGDMQQNMVKTVTSNSESDWMDVEGTTNRKPSVHLNEEGNRASEFPNFKSVPVVSSTSAASRCLPAHWDPTAAVCLICISGAYLWRGQCVTECPATSYSVNQTRVELPTITGICLPCHYSCLNCTGPSDSECTQCHADAQLSSFASSSRGSSVGAGDGVGGGGGEDRFCHPTVLVNQLTWYANWALGIELALALNVSLVVALCVYMGCSKRGCNTSCSVSCCGSQGRNASPNYRNLISANPPIQRNKGATLNAQYTDQEPLKGIDGILSSDEEM